MGTRKAIRIAHPRTFGEYFGAVFRLIILSRVGVSGNSGAVQTLKEPQKDQLEKLCQSNLETVAVWKLKEEFRCFFDLSDESSAVEFFDSWHKRVEKLGNVHLNKVARMFKEYWEGLLAYLRHRVSNGLAESINGRI